MRTLALTLVYTLLAGLSLNAQTGKERLSIFSDEMKEAYPSVVYDFLERYLYDVSQQQPGYGLRQRMSDDKVYVVSGSLENIKKLSPSIPFSITRLEDTSYEVLWTDTLGNTLLGLMFPIQYKLLLGKEKADIEKTLKAELDSYGKEWTAQPAATELKKDTASAWRSADAKSYYDADLNTATFYTCEGNPKDGKAEPIYSPEKKWQSAANLFHGIIGGTENYKIYIEQKLYGFNTYRYTVSLNQWLNYCKDKGFDVYFGIEEEREDGLKALLIARNPHLAYNHMLSIIIPTTFVEKRGTVMKAKLNAYIPTDNVKNLYQQYIDKKNKKIKVER